MTHFFCAVWSCLKISLERADFYKTWYVLYVRYTVSAASTLRLTLRPGHVTIVTDYKLDDRNSISGRSKPVMSPLQSPIKAPRRLSWNPSGLCMPPAERKSAGFEVAASSEGSVRIVKPTAS